MKLEKRTEKLNAIRARHLVPGNMFGKSIDSVSVQADLKDIMEAIKTYGHNMTFKVTLDGAVHNVYFKNVQTHILKPNDVIHFDLHRVSETETISAQIPIVILGKEAFFQSRAYAQQGIQSLQAEYTVGHGISNVEVDISALEVGDAIYVKDLTVDAAITLKDDPDTLIVAIKESASAEEPETADVAEPIDTEEENSDETAE